MTSSFDQKAYNKEYYLAHKEEILSKAQGWYRSNKALGLVDDNVETLVSLVRYLTK